jgi:hypothetical protein
MCTAENLVFAGTPQKFGNVTQKINYYIILLLMKEVRVRFCFLGAVITHQKIYIRA